VILLATTSFDQFSFGQVAAFSKVELDGRGPVVSSGMLTQPLRALTVWVVPPTGMLFVLTSTVFPPLLVHSTIAAKALLRSTVASLPPTPQSWNAVQETVPSTH
jgi:hypothetical protein